MKDYRSYTKLNKNRIALTDEDYNQLYDGEVKHSIPEMVKRTGLSYIFIYNIVRRRVKTISERNYKLLFGKEPTVRAFKKVDGSLFRNLVKLWLFLNDDVTQADLFSA